MRYSGLSVSAAALCLSLSCYAALMSDSVPYGTAAVTTWSSPMQIAATAGLATAPKLVTNASGTSLATWVENIPTTLNARIFMPGVGWGPTVLLSDGSGLMQPPEWTAIGDDGTAVVGWRQVVEAPSFESQVIVRTYTPGAGWGPAQKLSTLGGFGTAAVAPDGRAHMIYLDGSAFVIRTLDPGSQTWSTPLTLSQVAFQGEAQLVADTGVAYAAFTDGGSAVLLGTYTTATGWTAPDVAAAGNPETGVFVGSPQLAVNNGQAILAWAQFDNFPRQTHAYVRRLTGAGGTFEAPLTSCRFAVQPDATVVAMCDQNLGEVAGCFDPTRGGPVPAHYHQIVSYRLSPVDVWSGPEALSSDQARATFGQILMNHDGSVFAYWTQEVPCQTVTILVGGRLLLGGAWRAEVDNTDGLHYYADSSLTIDDKAIVRAVWSAGGIQNRDNVFYAELAPPTPTIAPEIGRLYHIVSRHSGKCLAGQDHRKGNGTLVVQETCSHDPGQTFWFRDAGGGYFNIVNRHAKKDIDVAGISSENGATIHLWDDWGGDNQKFRFDATSDGFFGLIAGHSGRALDLAAWSTADGAPIIQWQYHGGNNQQWRLEELPGHCEADEK